MSERRAGSPADPSAAKPSTPSTSSSGGGFRLPESGLADEILAAYAAQISGAPALDPRLLETPEEPLPAGPDRLYALADRLAKTAHRVVEQAPETPEVWVTFGIGAESYAIPVETVEEVLRVSTITRLPYAPAAVRGVTHHRGRVLTVLDLRVRLGLPEAEITPHSRIAVIASRGRSIGLLVDVAFQVAKLLRSGIQPPPADVMTERSHFLVGVHRTEESLLILLDVDRVLLLDAEESGPPETTRSTPNGVQAEEAQ